VYEFATTHVGSSISADYCQWSFFLFSYFILKLLIFVILILFYFTITYFLSLLFFVMLIYIFIFVYFEVFFLRQLTFGLHICCKPQAGFATDYPFLPAALQNASRQGGSWMLPLANDQVNLIVN